MSGRQDALLELIRDVRQAGGTLRLRDGRAVVDGEVPPDLLMRIHRHRRRIERLLG